MDSRCPRQTHAPAPRNVPTVLINTSRISGSWYGKKDCRISLVAPTIKPAKTTTLNRRPAGTKDTRQSKAPRMKNRVRWRLLRDEVQRIVSLMRGEVLSDGRAVEPDKRVGTIHCSQRGGRKQNDADPNSTHYEPPSTRRFPRICLSVERAGFGH